MLFFDAEILEERDAEVTTAAINALLRAIHEFNPELVL
jgi:hypothetical protein